jgi:hypothetical protein
MTITTVSVCVEYADGDVRYRTARGENVSNITRWKARVKARIEAEPLVVHAGVGAAVTTNHYGAH